MLRRLRMTALEAILSFLLPLIAHGERKIRIIDRRIGQHKGHGDDGSKGVDLAEEYEEQSDQCDDHEGEDRDLVGTALEEKRWSSH